MCNKLKEEQSMRTALFGEVNIPLISFVVTFKPMLVSYTL